LGISEFATLQQFITDLGADTGISVLHNGMATGLRLVGLADPAVLTAAQFVFSTAGTNNFINGSSGADDLFGGLGNDRLYGSGGADRLFGEAGNDTLMGSGTAADSLFGGSGDDFLRGAYGSDSLTGGDGGDTLQGDYGGNYSSDAADTLSGGLGADSLHGGGGGGDALDGGADADTLSGDRGLDTLTGGTGADLFRLGGTQYAGGIYDGETDRLTDFSLADGDRIDVSSLGISEFATLQQFITDLGADTGISVLHNGLATGLRLVGLADPAVLTAAQFVFSTAGTNNFVSGSSGRTTCSAVSARTPSTAPPGRTACSARQGTIFSSAMVANDSLFGGSGDDFLRGAYGSDSLTGGDGGDTLQGDYGGNYSSDAADTLSGGLGADSLHGGGGGDALDGGADADTLSGDRGLDTLTGGTGADLFRLGGTQYAAASMMARPTASPISRWRTATASTCRLWAFPNSPRCSSSSPILVPIPASLCCTTAWPPVFGWSGWPIRRC
jgi:Ca2+-binding RTX toxin-like protein